MTLYRATVIDGGALDGPILSIWAHPDDETYLAGATMAAAVDAGTAVTCVTATLGEHGTATSPGSRMVEGTDGFRLLGGQDPRRDGAVEQVPDGCRHGATSSRPAPGPPAPLIVDAGYRGPHRVRRARGGPGVTRPRSGTRRSARPARRTSRVPGRGRRPRRA